MSTPSDHPVGDAVRALSLARRLAWQQAGVLESETTRRLGRIGEHLVIARTVRTDRTALMSEPSGELDNLRRATSSARVATHQAYGRIHAHIMTVETRLAFAIASRAGATPRPTGLRRSRVASGLYVHRHPVPDREAGPGEVSRAASAGIVPMRVGEPGFDGAIAAGPVKWAVLADDDLLIIPERHDGVVFSHWIVTAGTPVRAAGRAKLTGTAAQGYQGVWIDNRSPRYPQSGASLDVGVAAFADLGVEYPRGSRRRRWRGR